VRAVTVAAIAAVFAVVAGQSVAVADPSPESSPSAAASSQPAGGGPLTTEQLRALLVGKSYTLPWRDDTEMTIEVHPNGTLHGSLAGLNLAMSRMSAAAAYQSADGTYTIANDLYCWKFGGMWAPSNGKPTCAHVTQSANRYYLGRTQITIVEPKK